MTKNDTAAARVPAPRKGRRRTPADTAVVDDASALQARLMQAQATIERDYTRLRELESRYRHLFDAAGALLVVEVRSLRILDANRAAETLLGKAASGLVGSPLGAAFEAGAGAALENFAADVQRGERSGPLRAAAAAAGRGRLTLTGTPFRQDGDVVLLLHLAAADARAARLDAEDDRDDSRDDLASYAGGAPDGVVLTDLAGRILQANAAFVELVQLATERQVRGESLGRWLGRTSVDLGVLVTNLRQRGTLKLFSTSLRAEYGTLTEVEISAAMVSVRDDAFLGFTIRDVGRRLAGDTHARDDLSKSVGQLAELVGRVPMKEIVGNTAGLIEKMCIEAALQLTRDNRAAAAELLGLSRQSLYVKLRRYGMGDLGSDEEVETA